MPQLLRFSGPGLAYAGLTALGRWNGRIEFVEEHLLDPLRWKTPRRIFVNSMSDLFHENVTDEMRDRIFAVMALCARHTFQILTKRPERMLAYLGEPGRRSDVMLAAGDLAFEIEAHVKYPRSMFPKNAEVVYDLGADRDECGCRVSSNWPLLNVWLGVSVENQKAADERIPLLLKTPAAVRFISAEPLLRHVSLEELLSVSGIGRYLNALSNAGVDPGAEIATRLDWVICGGESGPGARPMHPAWACSLRDQCVAAGVPFFFKQWGEWRDHRWDDPDNKPHVRLTRDGKDGQILGSARDNDVWMARLGKKSAGDLLDGVQWHQFPEVAHGKA
jgi:protein gp37